MADLIADKERVKEFANSLRKDFPDLCHEDSYYTELWIERAKALKLVNAWWDYMVLISHAKAYIKRNCPCYLSRFDRLLKKG